MIITTQYTADYKHKADLLAESVAKYWPGRFIPIEFKPEDCQSYRKNWPKNRPSYASMQAGEFVDRPEFADVPDDEIIICVDADTVMNRAFTDAEMENLIFYSGEYHFISVRGAYPASKLPHVMANLGVPELHVWVNALFGGQFIEVEFTASIIIGRKKHFRDLSKYYLNCFDEMADLSEHHAVTQLLINLICYKYFSVAMFGGALQCGAWYDGCTEEDARNAIFNHTK